MKDSDIAKLIMAFGPLIIIMLGIFEVDFSYVLMFIFFSLALAFIMFGIYCWIKGES